MRYLLRVLESRHQENGEQSQAGKAAIRLEDLAESIGGLEQKTRERYSEDILIESDEFVQMMIIDGCFVLELLRLYFKFDNEVC